MQNQAIKFYKTGEEFDFFSNVTDIGFDVWLDGQLLHARSSEALFQGLKGYAPNQFNSANDNALNTPTRPHALQLITDKGVPGAHLQRAGSQYKNNIPNSFHQPLSPELNYKFSIPNGITMKEQFMYEILLIKATQNIEVLKALLETGNNEIIENTHLGTPTPNQPNCDDFWGNGKDLRGKNALGKAWMRVRETLNQELQRTGQVMVRTQLSDTLICNCFGLNQAKNQHSNANKQAITQHDLSHTQTPKTVAQIHTNRANKRPLPAPVVHAPVQATLPLPAPAVHAPRVQATLPLSQPVINHGPGLTAKARVLHKLLAFHALKLIIENDMTKPGQKILKLAFNSPTDADNFARTITGWPNVTNHPSCKIAVIQYIVALDAITAQNVFNQLGIPTHGKTNPHQMFDALVHELHPLPTTSTLQNTTKKFVSTVFGKILTGALIATAIAALIIVSLVSAGIGLGVGAICATIICSFFGGGAIGGFFAKLSGKMTTSNQANAANNNAQSNSNAVINKVTHALPNQKTNTIATHAHQPIQTENIAVKPVQPEMNRDLTTPSLRLN